MHFLEFHGIQESFSWCIVLVGLNGHKALQVLLVDRLFIFSPRRAPSLELPAVSWICYVVS